MERPCASATQDDARIVHVVVARELGGTAIAQPDGMTPLEYFKARRIFTIEEFAASDPNRSRKTVDELLKQHVRRGHIHRLRRGVYEIFDEDFHDPVIAASKLAPDAVLAYDTALHLWSRAPWFPIDRVTVLTRARRRAHRYLNPEVGTPIFPICPRAVLGGTWTWFVKELALHGHQVRITHLERTLVDVLDRIELAPPTDELWKWFSRTRRGRRKRSSAACPGSPTRTALTGRARRNDPRTTGTGS